MTTKCNLACTYCYRGDCIHNIQSIDVEFAKIGVQDFFQEFQSYHIRYFGAGEPTLEIKKIKEIHEYAKGLATNKLTSEIQTNGFFSSAIAKWLAENIEIIWISCDGPPDIQDALRPTLRGTSTSAVIERNIATMLSHKRSGFVGIRSTITPLNIDRQIDMVKYFSRLGVAAIFTDPVFPPVNLSEFLPSPDKSFMLNYAKEFLEARNWAEQLGVFYGSILAVNFDEETEHFCRSCLPVPHLATDGSVTCCDMAFLGDVLPELAYGKYDPTTKSIQYFPEKIAAIRTRRASNLTACAGCEVLYHCAGACFGEGVNETGHLLGVKKDYCEAIKYLAKHLPLNAGLYPYLHP